MNFLSAIWRDLIHAARSLAKARAFTFVCVMTLGIGMAPVIAIQYGSRMFTTAPPMVKTEGIVEVVTSAVGPHRAAAVWSYPDFISLRDADIGASLTGWAGGESKVELPDGKVTSQTMYVASNYFSTMGVTLARGTGFPPSTDPVVIVGYAFWQTRLAADPAIVGKSLTLNGVPHAVVGIAPDQFVGHLVLHRPEFFVPLERHPLFLADRNARFDRSKAVIRIHGRLSPGVTVAQASSAVSAVTSRLASEYPATNEFRAGVVEPYHAIGALEAWESAILIRVWQAMAALPLLVVCLNISSMMQVRGAMRERELSIRQAIGASRRRLVQHLLAESIILAGAGGTLASIVLFNIPPVLSWWLGEPMPPQMQAALTVDFSMLAICAGLCLATSLVFGWLPALRFSRPVIMTVLKDEAGTGGIRAGRAQRVATALQVALSVPLLILGFMSLERVRATATADLGFDAELLYAAPVESELQARTIRDTLLRTGGVDAVTVADGLPLDFRSRMAQVSRPLEVNHAPAVVRAHVTRVGDGYLETMGIALVGGRRFTADDGAGAPMVTIVSKPLADTLFPEADAIGRQVSFDIGGGGDRAPRPLTIVGVTNDFPTSQMTTTREQLLIPLAQYADLFKDSVRVEDDRAGTVTLMIVARGEAGESAAKLTAALENAMREADPDFDRAAIVTGAWLRQNSMDDFFNGFAVGAIGGGVTLLLAALGLYGVVGLMVSTRTRELAVRVTLGASRLSVIGMILFDVVKLVSPGIVAGVLITIGFARLDGGVRISSVEPIAYVAGAAIALVIAVLSSLPPARRAASVQPMVAMRST